MDTHCMPVQKMGDLHFLRFGGDERVSGPSKTQGQMGSWNDNVRFEAVHCTIKGPNMVKTRG